MEKTVFVIVEDWIVKTEGGTNTRIFSTYEKAKEAYDLIIKEEKETGYVAHSIDSDDCDFGSDENDSNAYVLEEAHFPIDESRNRKQVLHNWQWYLKGWYCEYHINVQLLKQPIDEDQKKEN